MRFTGLNHWRGDTVLGLLSLGRRDMNTVREATNTVQLQLSLMESCVSDPSSLILRNLVPLLVVVWEKIATFVMEVLCGAHFVAEHMKGTRFFDLVFRWHMMARTIQLSFEQIFW